jgi:hypothetical protein
VGSASGVLSESLEAAIIVMVILTTFLAPPLLRVVFNDEQDEADAGTEPGAASLAAAEGDTVALDQDSSAVPVAEGATQEKADS